MAVSDVDVAYLNASLELAARGLFSATPNPRVGCVLVKDGRIVGRGYHERAGGPHAEAAALAAAGSEAAGATAYVSLEPCAHHGRTPPCADALIAAGVARVVSAHRDPDARVAGQGLARIAAAGIATDRIELPLARDMNVGYFSRTERGRPWVRIKIGASLDGRTAMASGESQWITGPEARADVQAWRARSCAILTGVGTVLSDDPRLTVRDATYAVAGQVRQPMRVVVDSKLRTPIAAQLLTEPGNVLIASLDGSANAGVDALSKRASVVVLPADGHSIDLGALMSELGGRGVNELLVEAGARLTGALLRCDLWDEVLLYLAPRLLGSAARPLAELRLARLADGLEGRVVEVIPIGDDLRIRLQRK